MLAEDPQWQRTWSLFFLCELLYRAAATFALEIWMDLHCKEIYVEGRKKRFFLSFPSPYAIHFRPATTAAAAQQWKSFLYFLFFFWRSKLKLSFYVDNIYSSSSTNEREMNEVGKCKFIRKIPPNGRLQFVHTPLLRSALIQKVS